MATYIPPKRATQFILYVSLASQSSAHTFQSNPTLASGDVKVSKDGGALANLSTLPVVTPASSKLVKVTLSASEMTADNVTVIFSDAAGAEWDDLTLNLQTSANQIDDLAGGNGGALSLEYTLTSSLDDSPIEGARVELYAEEAMSSIIDAQTTDAFGVVTFENLTAGTYYLKRIKSGWTFTNPDTETVA